MSKQVEILGNFGFGTMSLTWTPVPKPMPDSIEVLKFVTENDQFGVNFVNGGEFYGADDANLKLLKAFVESNTPEQNRELVLSIKGGLGKNFGPDGSNEGISRSIDNIIGYFPSDKLSRPKLLFEIARVDKGVKYEDTIGYINEYVKAGKIDGISLSEVGVESIKKAINAAPITCVEIEFSLMCQDILENGILEELSKHNVDVIAYSPLCRGYLTDYTVDNADTWLLDMPEGDLRRRCGKFQPETYKNNIILVKKLYKFAHEKKNTSLESLALSWIIAISERKSFRGISNLPKILPIPSGSTKEKLTKTLGSIIELTDDDLSEIDQICKETPVQGLRYDEHHEALLNA
jgi:pyridoxine 4-dehydrogenase